jgi:hypothetical protein
MEDEDCPVESRRNVTANDNEVETRLDAAVLRLARLIGRQIAREHFEALQAANDNGPSLRAWEAVVAEDQDWEGDER